MHEVVGPYWQMQINSKIYSKEYEKPFYKDGIYYTWCQEMKLAELPTEAIFDKYIPHQIVTVVLTCNWSLLSLVPRPTLFL